MSSNRTASVLAKGIIVYVIALVALVGVANLGLIPGSGDPQGTFGSYRVVIGVAATLFAIALGIGAATLGSLKSSPAKGFAALVVGGLVTGAAFVFMPWILYPADRYSPGMVWVILGGPIGFAAWAIGTLRAQRNDRAGRGG